MRCILTNFITKNYQTQNRRKTESTGLLAIMQIKLSAWMFLIIKEKKILNGIV